MSLRQHSSQLREVTAILPPFFLCSFSISSKDWYSRELWHETLWLCFLGHLQQGLQTHQHQIPFELA